MSYEAAASFPLTFLTAWHMLITLGKLKCGQDVLILGAGSGMGVAGIQIASAAGARVLASSTSAEKLEAAKQLGAQVAIHSPPDDLLRRVVRATEGRGVDLVLEHVGPAVFDKALKALRPGGTLVTCGATTGPTVELDLRYVFSRELRILGAKMGSLWEFHEVVRLVAAGKLKPVVDATFPLEEARGAHEYLASRKQFGKVVLKI
jgi:NADPH:quinone reductase-like Zn-dependent oxidoreductase